MKKKRLLLMMGKTTAATRFEIYNKKSSLLFLRRLCNWIKRIIDEKNIYMYDAFSAANEKDCLLKLFYIATKNDHTITPQTFVSQACYLLRPQLHHHPHHPHHILLQDLH